MTLMIAWLIAFRVLNALTIRTMFDVDEYFQCLHYFFAFGDSKRRKLRII